MGGCSTLGRIVLVILNIIFVLISLALIAGGVVLKFFPTLPLGFLLVGLESIGNFVKQLPANLPPGVTPPTGQIFIPSSLDFLPVAESIGTALLVLGCVLFALGFLACCGACYKWRPLLIAFTVVVLIIIIVLSVVGGLFFKGDSILHKNIRSELGATARKEAKHPSGPFAIIMNVLALKLECCGFSGPSDFDDHWDTGTGLNSVPKACCARSADAQTDCFLSPKKSAFIQEGCYDKLFNFINSNKAASIGGFVAVIILLLLEVIFAIIITVDIGSSKIGPV